MEVPKRFLLIDDDPHSNKLCRMAIAKFFSGMPIIAFTDSEKAIEYIMDEYSKNPVSTVIFLDINMPGLDGWEILDKLNELPLSVSNNLKTFLLTSSLLVTDAYRAMDNALISGFLEKPLTQKRMYSLFSKKFVAF